MEFLHYVSRAVAFISVAILLFGILQSLILFLANEFQRSAGKYEPERIVHFRNRLGQYLLYALELLIASDIIETIVNPGLEELAQVGGVVLIRTVLSFFLTKEIKEERKA